MRWSAVGNVERPAPKPLMEKKYDKPEEPF